MGQCRPDSLVRYLPQMFGLNIMRTYRYTRGGMVRRFKLCRKHGEGGYEGDSLAEDSGSRFGRKNEKLDILNCMVIVGSLFIFNKWILIMFYLNEFSEEKLESVKVF